MGGGTHRNGKDAMTNDDTNDLVTGLLQAVDGLDLEHPDDAIAAADTLRRIVAALPAKSAGSRRVGLGIAAAADRLEQRAKTTAVPPRRRLPDLADLT